MSTKKDKEPQLTPVQATQFRERIKTVVNDGKRASIEMCEVVYDSDVNMVRVNGNLKYCWQTWGYDSWEEFLGREMHMHLQTGRGLRKVWQVFYVDLANEWNKSLLLGISKMRLLTRVDLTPRNVEGWLRKAGPVNCAKLLAMVGGDEERKSFAVQMTNSQMNSLRKSLEQVRGMLTNGENMTRGELLVQMGKLARESSGSTRRAA